MAKFEPGNPGGPGRPKGARNKLSESFLEVLYTDWQEHGKVAVEAVRANDPSTYLRVVASILPKEIELDLGGDVVALLAAVDDARRKRSTPEVVTGVEPSGTDTVRH